MVGFGWFWGEKMQKPNETEIHKCKARFRPLEPSDYSGDRFLGLQVDRAGSYGWKPSK